MTKNKKMMISALPFVALVVLLAVFCGIVSSKGYRLDMYIKIVFNEGIVSVSYTHLRAHETDS